MLPSGIGWNVETLFWIQTSAIEAGLFVMIYWLTRFFEPIMKRKNKIVASIDRFTEESTADAELKRIRGRDQG